MPRRTIARLARAFGFEIIPASREPVEHELVWARNMQRIGGPGHDRMLYLTRPVETVHLQWLLDLHRVATALDVGANHGQFARGLREVGFTGELHCFEPQPELLSELRAGVGAQPHTHIHSHALGRLKATLDLTRYSEDSFSSFHPVSAQGLTSFGKALRPIARYSVPVQRLDEIWRALGSPDPARCLLKTDTQGHDLAVLEGAGSLLDRIPLVLTEAPIIPLYQDAAGFQELCAFLAARGLRLSGTYPVSFDPATGALLELNAWFARHPAAPQG